MEKALHQTHKSGHSSLNKSRTTHKLEETRKKAADALLELKTRTKRLAFLESHAVESDVKSDDDEVCRICLERLDACGGYDTTTSLVSVLPCGHAFHDACLRKWAKYKCPSCRGNYGEADVRPAVRSVTGARAVEATKLDAFLEDAQQAVARGEQSVRDAASHALKDRQAGAMHLPIAIAHKEADAPRGTDRPQNGARPERLGGATNGRPTRRSSSRTSRRCSTSSAQRCAARASRRRGSPRASRRLLLQSRA